MIKFTDDKGAEFESVKGLGWQDPQNIVIRPVAKPVKQPKWSVDIRQWYDFSHKTVASLEISFSPPLAEDQAQLIKEAVEALMFEISEGSVDSLRALTKVTDKARKALEDK